MAMLEAEQIDRLWSTSTPSQKVWNVDFGRDHQGEAADRRGACARRDTTRETLRPAERAGGYRASAAALQLKRASKEDEIGEDTGHGHRGGRSSAVRRAPAQYDRKTSRRQA